MERRTHDPLPPNEPGRIEGIEPDGGEKKFVIARSEIVARSLTGYADHVGEAISCWMLQFKRVG